MLKKICENETNYLRMRLSVSVVKGKQQLRLAAAGRVSLTEFGLSAVYAIYIFFSNWFLTKVVIMALSVLIGLQQVCGGSAQKMADEQHGSIKNTAQRQYEKHDIWVGGKNTKRTKNRCHISNATAVSTHARINKRK